MRQSSFDRTLYNDLKLGAYYTDVGHAARIGQMFSLKGETCILEPSVGDASAVTAFANAVKRSGKINIFGVELNAKTYQEVKDKLHFSINADFLKGVRITPKVFSLCFANPPYGTCNEGKDRLETEFVKKIYSFMMPEGYLVLIIPEAAISDMAFSKEFLARFEVLKTYKFDEEEYKKYHQFAVISKRRRSIGVQRSELLSFREEVAAEEFPYLPALGEYEGESFLVPESKDDDVVLFTAVNFDFSAAGKNVLKSSLYEKLQEALVKPYRSMSVGDPPLPLKKDLLYLSSIAGAGEGIAGSEEDGDLHLQRGTVNVEQFKTYEKGENDSLVERVVSRSVVSINVIDNCGHVITLK